MQNPLFDTQRKPLKIHFSRLANEMLAMCTQTMQTLVSFVVKRM